MRGDGRIYQRGGLFYIAYSVGSREFRESTGSREWQDAEQLLNRRLQEREQAVQALTAVTFDALTKEYIAEYELHQHRTIGRILGPRRTPLTADEREGITIAVNSAFRKLK